MCGSVEYQYHPPLSIMQPKHLPQCPKLLLPSRTFAVHRLAALEIEPDSLPADSSTRAIPVHTATFDRGGQTQGPVAPDVVSRGASLAHIRT